MPAETLKDPSYQLGTAGEHLGNGQAILILDEEGRWCHIPCAGDTQTLLALVDSYVKPNIPQEIQRLKKLQMLNLPPKQKDVVLGMGLFYYEPPESDMFVEEAWKTQLAEAFERAGLPVDPIPPQRFPSLHPDKDEFLDQHVDPLLYWSVSDLMTNTFILSPALSQFEPGLLTGDCLAVGYNAAIEIDGPALFGLLKDNEVMRFKDNPTWDRVTTRVIRDAVKRILE